MATMEDRKVAVRVGLNDLRLTLCKDSCLNLKKNFSLKFTCGADVMFETYSESVEGGGLQWITACNTVVSFESLSDMARTVMKISLMQKRKGKLGLLGLKIDRTISGVSVNLRTLATGPVRLEMALQKGERAVGTLSVSIEFEVFKEVTLEVRQVRLAPHVNEGRPLPFSDSIALSAAVRGKAMKGDPWTVDETSARQVAKKYSNTILFDRVTSFTMWASVRSLMNVTLFLTVEGGDAAVVALTAQVPMKKHALELKEETPFLCTVINSVDGSEVDVRGTIRLVNRPVLMQMAGGLLTQRGVIDPIVAFPQLPLPYCMLYSVTARTGDMILPWVRIDCLSSPSYYYNTETGHKMRGSIKELQVVSRDMKHKSGRLSNTTSTYVINELFFIEQARNSKRVDDGASVDTPASNISGGGGPTAAPLLPAPSLPSNTVESSSLSPPSAGDSPTLSDEDEEEEVTVAERRESLTEVLESPVGKSKAHFTFEEEILEQVFVDTADESVAP